MSHFRTKGRIALSLKFPTITYLKALRMDYFTDVLLLCALIALVLIDLNN